MSWLFYLRFSGAAELLLGYSLLDQRQIIPIPGALMNLMRCRSRFLLSFLLFSISFAVAQNSQTQPSSNQPGSTRSEDDNSSYRAAMEQADKKIADEVKAHSELIKNLEYLTTQIGARLTGSPQMNRASDWTLQRFKDYGVSANLETTEVPHSWTRGQDTAEITAPVKKNIEIRSLGWSKATDGPVSGNVYFVNSDNPADVQKYKGKLKGAIVITRPPAELPAETEIPNNAYDAVIPPSHGIPPAGARGRFRER